MRSGPVLGFVLSFGVLGYSAISAQQATTDDPIQQLVKQVQAGKSNLRFDNKHGYLKDLLTALDIKPESQTLVWSKTSLQGPRISPQAPRAIYFNDHTYVGWVNGGDLIEIATVHPEKGTRFYTLRNHQAPSVDFQDEFQRCIACHAGPGLGGVPRLLSRSVNADSQGYQILRGGGRIMTPRTPLRERWGGWYVSGDHGKQRHRGNSPVKGDDEGFTFDVELGANKTDLNKYFDTSEYLHPHSDIVALMVMEHQMDVQNEIIRASNATKKHLADPETGTLEEACEPLVKSLLSIGEVQLDEPIKGMGPFQSMFESGGTKDARGRSLRTLDLNKRLFKFPISPMIESASFRALPKQTRDYVYKRFEAISKDANEFPQLTAADRIFLQDFLALR